jgi:hypothetical protein
MAHFAEIDENNIVIRVVVTDNNDPNNDEGYQWLIDNLGGRWIKTSYNTWAGEHKLGGTPFRKNYATIGGSYDERLDAFIPPMPEEKFGRISGKPIAWDLDENTCQWVRRVIES